MRWAGREIHKNTLVGKLAGNNQFKDAGINVRIILK
jgi:hypothetical protein